MTAADQSWVAANGRGTTPALSPALTDEQIAAIVEYTPPACLTRRGMLA